MTQSGAPRPNILTQVSYPFPSRPQFRRQSENSQKSIMAGVSPLFMECLQILCQMEGHEFGFFFKWLVNPYALKLDNYWQIVNRPMDLFTIRHKIMNKFYKTYSDFDKDMNLMFSNSELYNRQNKEIMGKITTFKKDYQQISGNRRIKIQTLERQELNNQEKVFSNFLDNYFTEQKREELGKVISQFDQKTRSILVQTIKEKFPSIQIHNNSIILLSSLTGIQLKFIFDLVSSRKKIKKVTRPMLPHQIKKKKEKRDEESSFEIEEDSK